MENTTLCMFRNCNTVREYHLLTEFWPHVRNGVFNVRNIKVASVRDPKVKLAHRCIATTIAARKETTHRITKIDLYYLYYIYTPEVACNIPHWLAKYFKGIREKNLIYRGMLVTIIARAIMELHGGMCVWPGVIAMEEEDDEGDNEGVGEDAGRREVGGSADLYRDMSQDSEEFVNVFVRIDFSSTIKLVSFDESQVVTFNGKFVCGFRNSNYEIESQSENTVDNLHRFVNHWIKVLKGNEKVTKVIYVENWRIDNSRVLRWVDFLIEWNSSVSSTKSTIQSTFRFRRYQVPRQELSNSNPFDALNLVENDVELGTNACISKSADKGTINGSSSSTPIVEKIDKIECQIREGILRFVDDDRNPLVPSGNVDSDSKVEVIFDETTNLRVSISVKDRSDKGYGNKSLLENGGNHI
uniref:Retrotransposon Orf1 n=1 Tax=Tanacetum cinerariifolium TaxID=118510 RepID=A0A699H4Y7_TANCI|nr:retrotransposon Orf1 [Tanacetum cinerariifolium]